MVKASIRLQKGCVASQNLHIISTIADTERRLNGVQFDPEIDLTENGRKMLHNFLFDIRGLQRGFTMEKREQQYIDYVRLAPQVNPTPVRRVLGRELGLPAELLERHPFPGPGLSIRIIYAGELFMEADFGETQVLIRLMVDYANMAAKDHVLLNRIEIASSEEGRLILEELSSSNQYVATLLSICIVGVQGACRTYSYCVALSSDQTQPNWNDLATYARLISRTYNIHAHLSEVMGQLVFRRTN
ncbi:GMP synthase [Daphnia magna]|uniref:GMP synthase n=1 Tax=Daphnia magna TaxID=35525 RepID=A0A162DC45_9CRUS|nr:GMP synthase [Daphnia magna]